MPILGRSEWRHLRLFAWFLLSRLIFAGFFLIQYILINLYLLRFFLHFRNDLPCAD